MVKNTPNDSEFPVDPMTEDYFIPGTAAGKQRLRRYFQKIRIPFDIDDDALTPEVYKTLLALAQELHSTQKVAELVRIDPLTELFNPRGLREEMERAVDRRARDSRYRPATVVFIDLDDFGSVNTQFSHEGGNAALQHTAKFLSDNFRPGDVVARYGGDEFAIIMYGATAEQAEIHLKRLQEQFAKSTCTFDKRKIPLSFQYSVRAITGKEQVGALLKEASAIMLEHKPAAIAIEEAAEQAAFRDKILGEAIQGVIKSKTMER